jgi:hypothetical protein
MSDLAIELFPAIRTDARQAEMADMQIAALRIGPGVPRRGFVGLVAATHARACLIALTNDRLVTLVTPQMGGLPNGITVDTLDGFSFERSLNVGARAAVRGGMLRVDDGFCIDLRASRPWRSFDDGTARRSQPHASASLERHLLP